MKRTDTHSCQVWHLGRTHMKFYTIPPITPTVSDFTNSNCYRFWENDPVAQTAYFHCDCKCASGSFVGQSWTTTSWLSGDFALSNFQNWSLYITSLSEIFIFSIDCYEVCRSLSSVFRKLMYTLPCTSKLHISGMEAANAVIQVSFQSCTLATLHKPEIVFF